MKVRQLNCFTSYSKNMILAPKRITCCRYEFFNWSVGNFDLVAWICLLTVPAIVDGCYYYAYPLLVCYLLLLINSLFSPMLSRVRLQYKSAKGMNTRFSQPDEYSSTNDTGFSVLSKKSIMAC
jgi:hypothetical protein